MEIKQLLLKQMGMLSSVLGLVLGVITIIPFICNFSFFALIVLSAPIILVYMKKLDLFLLLLFLCHLCRWQLLSGLFTKVLTTLV